MKPKIISIVGLTASGKSGLGINLAQEFNGEIISCDSRQVYRGLDLGSGKVTLEEQKLTPHHLLDVAEPVEYFNVADFQKMAYSAIEDILKRSKLPILVGGSGLYSRSIVEGFVFGLGKTDKTLESYTLEHLQKLCKERDIELNNSDFNNKRRLIRKLSVQKTSTQNQPQYEVLQICLMPPRDIIEKLVVDRIQSRLDEGMIEETRNLIKNGVSAEFLQSLGLEYFWNVEYIEKRITLEEYKKNLAQKIMNFVKRQRTWFGKEKNTHFLTDPNNFYVESKKLIEEFVK